ncbi:MAG: DUF2807 domain-containing protein [Bacteroidetes bacterium]|nr:DUF2807 domain-containing protein [Bacteroidota bacterium]
MKNSTTYIIVSCCIIITALSCKKENRNNCIKGTGPLVREERVMPAFDTLRVFDNIHLFLDMDSQRRVVVECGEKLLPGIQTDVINNELIIRNNNICNWLRSYKRGIINVYVYTPPILKIVTNSTAPVKGMDTIKTHYMYLSVMNTGDVELTLNMVLLLGDTHSSGDVILHGTCGILNMWLLGTNFLRSYDLETSYSFIQSHTTGDSYTYVTTELGVLINSEGNIYYRGNPSKVAVENSGTGELVKVD